MKTKFEKRLKMPLSLFFIVGFFLLTVPACFHELEITTDSGQGTFKSKIIASNTWTTYRVSPGTTVSVSGFPVFDVQAIIAVRLGIYSQFKRQPPINNLDEFGEPNIINLQFDVNSVSADNRSFSASLAPPVRGIPPSVAFLQVEYRDASGSRQTINLGEVITSVDPVLYFVPHYVVNLGVIDIPIGADAFGHTVVSSVLFDTVFDRHFAIKKVRLHQPDGFGGTSYLHQPCAQPRLPRQGYHVTMGPFNSGTLVMQYHIVGPEGMQPQIYGMFDQFGVLGDYQGTLSFGLPNIYLPEYSDSLSHMPGGVPQRCEN